MKTALALLFLLSTNAFAALAIKPGLWSLEMAVNSSTDKVTQTLSTLSATKRSKMKDAMGDVTPGGLVKSAKQACYTREMLSQADVLGRSEKQKCTSKVTTNSTKKVATTFRCDDGVTGDATWTVTNNENFKGVVNTKSPEGYKSQISYTGKFVKNSCGAIKPIL